MMMGNSIMLQTLRAHFEEHYRSGATPWDTQITPPEVKEFWASGRARPEGIALDLGCGPATNVRFLASLGLTAIGVDYVPAALYLGQTRATADAISVRSRIQLLAGDVTCLPFSGLGASYVLDVGCFHGLPLESRSAYAEGVIDNLCPGGYYHLYAFDRVAELADDPERWFRGMEENEVVERFTPHLEVVEIQRARPDRYPCRWYLLRRLSSFAAASS
jgi:SAM-dependent methyltransferase